MAKLIGGKMQPAEYLRNTWRVTLPAEVKYAEIFVPSFWANVASKFVRGDIIEVWPEDGSWFATLIVRVSARTHAIVGELRYVNFNVPESATPLPGGEIPEGTAPTGVNPPTVEWKGPKLKWAVIRHDGEYMKDGFESKTDAQKWVDENDGSLV